MPRIKWETLIGNEYEGELIEIDNGTGIVRMDDGSTKAIDLTDDEIEKYNGLLP